METWTENDETYTKMSRKQFEEMVAVRKKELVELTRDIHRIKGKRLQVYLDGQMRRIQSVYFHMQEIEDDFHAKGE